MSASRLAGLVVISAIVLASCGRSGQVNLLSADELPQDLYGDEETGSATSRELTVTVYFVRVASDPVQSTLEPVTRAARTDRTKAEFAMVQLLDGPDEQEVADGLRQAIGAGTRLLGVTIDGDVASVNLTGEFEGTPENYIQILSIAQVVWTLTSLEVVDRVRFLVHGVPQPVIDPDGTAHELVSRARYSRVAPRAGAAEVDTCPVGEDC